MKTAIVIPGLLVAAAISAVLYIRLAPSDPARWHVDPTTTPDPSRPNFARIETTIPLPPAEVLARIEAQARHEGAVRLAGDEGLVTWVARSRLMRYPDYVSIRLDGTGSGTRVTALSRARFGANDLGVNAARLERWISRLQP